MKTNYYSGTLAVNALALLLFVLMFVIEKQSRKKKGGPVTKAESFFSLIILWGIILSVALGFSALIEKYYTPEREKLFICCRSVAYEALQVCCFLVPIYLVCHNNEEQKYYKYRFIYAVPLLANAVLLVINTFTGCVFFFSQKDRVAFGTWFYPMATLIFFYVVVSAIMLFRVNRIFVIVPLFLLVVGYYFSLTFFYVSLISIVMAVFVIFIRLLINSRTILRQLCLILIPLLLAATLFVGNFVTVSSFLSYLKTIHDRNEDHMNEVIREMESYESLPWLLDYWEMNPEKIHETDAKERDPLYLAFDSRSLRGQTVDTVKEKTPEIQQLYASACYTSLAEKFEFEYNEHNLDELDLISRREDGTAFVLLSGVRSEDGSYRLGDEFDIESEKIDWQNYLIVTFMGPVQWIWGMYNDDDDFGFHIKLEIPGHKNGINLCNSFKRREVYEHMEYISTFRVISLFVLMGIGLVVVYILFYAVVVPLDRIRRSLSEYSNDKDSKRVSQSLSKVRSQNETEDFAKEFSILAVEMDRYTQQVANLAAEKERSLTELRMASDIQTSVLPSPEGAFPDREEFELYAQMKPAKTV